MRIEYLMLVFAVLLSTTSQIFLKKSADYYGNEQKKTSQGKDGTEPAASSAHGLRGRILSQYLNPYVAAGYSLLFISLLIPLYALRFIEIKYSAIIESLGYVFIMVMSAIFLKEKITKRKLLGNLLIIVGVVIFGLNFFGITLI